MQFHSVTRTNADLYDSSFLWGSSSTDPGAVPILPPGATLTFPTSLCGTPGLQRCHAGADATTAVCSSGTGSAVTCSERGVCDAMRDDTAERRAVFRARSAPGAGGWEFISSAVSLLIRRCCSAGAGGRAAMGAMPGRGWGWGCLQGVHIREREMLLRVILWGGETEQSGPGGIQVVPFAG